MVQGVIGASVRACMRAIASFLLVLSLVSAAYAETDAKVQYDYDDLGRVIRVSYPGGPEFTYTYDAAGNRKTQEVSGGTTVIRLWDAPEVLEADASHPENPGELVFTVWRFGPSDQDITVQYRTYTGLYYYRARYYSSKLGRFLQTDPIGYEDNMNLYAYTGNDPVNNTDPSGKLGCEDCRVTEVVEKRVQPTEGEVAKKGDGYADGRFDATGANKFRIKSDGSGRAHKGIDIVAPKGQEVKAADDGEVVIASGGFKQAGNQVAIDHGDGTTSQSFHLDSIDVNKGDTVRAGDKIGEVGTTGNSSENTPHLHFEVRQGANFRNGVRGTAIDPSKWLADPANVYVYGPDVP